MAQQENLHNNEIVHYQGEPWTVWLRQRSTKVTFEQPFDFYTIRRTDRYGVTYYQTVKRSELINGNGGEK